MAFLFWWLIAAVLTALLIALAIWADRRRSWSRWLPTYLRESSRRRLPTDDDEVHVILCIADHYEPKADGADAAQGRARVSHWRREYPRLFGGLRDSDGRPPRHTFFFPIEEYEPEYLDALA